MYVIFFSCIHHGDKNWLKNSSDDGNIGASIGYTCLGSINSITIPK